MTETKTGTNTNKPAGLTTDRTIRTRKLTLTAAFGALICVIAPLSVPIGDVPLSLATIAVMLAGTISGPAAGCCASCIYILAGIVGLPVFAGFKGGIGVMAGPTGGFIAGYILLAAVCGLYQTIRSSGSRRDEARQNKKAKMKLPQRTVLLIALCAAGTIMLYVTGTAWYCLITGSNLTGAIATCVLPFLPGDAAKIAVCTTLTAMLEKAHI
jgi:biotin transport system substrate-specific component